MNPRERFIKTLKFAHPDRIYYSFGPPRKSTLEAWKLQGLPEMIRCFILPRYKRLVQLFIQHEVPLVMVDPDLLERVE